MVVTLEDRRVSFRPPPFEKVEPLDLKDLGYSARRKGILAVASHCVWWIEIKDRRSRIVQKDGDGLEEALLFLREREANRSVVLWLISSAPLCSKTRSRLLDLGVMVTEVPAGGEA